MNNEDPKNRQGPFDEANMMATEEAKAKREAIFNDSKRREDEKRFVQERLDRMHKEELDKELMGATDEHHKLLEEIRRAEDEARAIESSESFVPNGSKRVSELREKGKGLMGKFLAIPFRHPDLNVRLVQFYEGINRPDIKIVKGRIGWSIKNLDFRITKVETDSDGVPTKIFYQIPMTHYFHGELATCYIEIKMPEVDELAKPRPKRIVVPAIGEPKRIWKKVMTKDPQTGMVKELLIEER